jgi:hypothetical protein
MSNLNSSSARKPFGPLASLAFDSEASMTRKDFIKSNEKILTYAAPEEVRKIRIIICTIAISATVDISWTLKLGRNGEASNRSRYKQIQRRRRRNSFPFYEPFSGSARAMPPGEDLQPLDFLFAMILGTVCCSTLAINELITHIMKF